MSGENNVSIQFDKGMVELFSQMDEIREQYNLKRLNCIMLLIALLEERESVFYECLCETSFNSNPYKKIILECNQQLKLMAKKDEEEVLEEDKFNIILGQEEKVFYLSKELKKIIINAYQLVLEDVHIVIQVDVNNSIAGTKYRGMAEERFKLLVDYLNSHDNIILFIDEIHMVIGAGATSEDDSGNMSNALKPFLASKKAKVIGATTPKEFEKYFAKDGAFKRRFEKVIVKEPKAKEVYPMLKNSIKAHEEYHGVKIKRDMVEYAILISSCFNHNTHNPDRTNDLIDSAMVIAKESKKEYVDRECILQNFDINFEKFKKLEESQKISTAYHEAGHYLVWRKSEKLKNIKGITVSIMPAEDYLGVTVYDDLSDEVTVYEDRDYYIDYLAKCIAGRVAEKVYTSGVSAGAKSDLEVANKIAYQVVTKYGMTEKYGNKTYYEDYEYHMLSEKIINSINKEVKEIINKATKRAEEIIFHNEILLKKLVKALLEKNILDEKDLEEICKE